MFNFDEIKAKKTDICLKFINQHVKIFSHNLFQKHNFLAGLLNRYFGFLNQIILISWTFWLRDYIEIQDHTGLEDTLRMGGFLLTDNLVTSQFGNTNVVT